MLSHMPFSPIDSRRFLIAGRSRSYGGRSRWVRDPHPLRGSHVGEIETEGLAIMAKDMGIECWGLPDLEIRHFPG